MDMRLPRGPDRIDGEQGPEFVPLPVIEQPKLASLESADVLDDIQARDAVHATFPLSADRR
jgi:hypothetical protein